MFPAISNIFVYVYCNILHWVTVPSKSFQPLQIAKICIFLLIFKNIIEKKSRTFFFQINTTKNVQSLLSETVYKTLLLVCMNYAHPFALSCWNIFFPTSPQSSLLFKIAFYRQNRHTKKKFILLHSAHVFVASYLSFPCHPNLVWLFFLDAAATFADLKIQKECKFSFAFAECSSFVC